MRIKSVFGALVLLAAIGTLPGMAQGRVWYSGESNTGSYAVEIVVDGVPRPVYQYGGHAYSEGRMGEHYVVRIHNRTWRRVEAIISVDGRDAIDGRPAELSKRGYVIPAYTHIDVDGFRLNMSEVAAFRFTSIPDSYAARMGTPWEVGVIGVAIFPERVYYPPPRPPYAYQKSAPGHWDDAERGGAGAAESAPMRESRDLGTQFGEREVSPVTETSFVRENWGSPEVRLGLRYNSREGLCSMGMGGLCYPPYPPPWPPPPYYDPVYSDQGKFSEPPPGWEHFSPWY